MADRQIKPTLSGWVFFMVLMKSADKEYIKKIKIYRYFDDMKLRCIYVREECVFIQNDDLKKCSTYISGQRHGYVCPFVHIMPYIGIHNMYEIKSAQEE